jgi:hypothetical protein
MTSNPPFRKPLLLTVVSSSGPPWQQTFSLEMSFLGDILLFSFCLLDTGCLLFILIYFIITLSDLECDYLNAQECCAKLNFVILDLLSNILSRLNSAIQNFFVT